MMRLLLVDDEPIVLHSMRRLLLIADPDRVIDTAEDGVKALAAVEEAAADAPFDLVIADRHLPGMCGEELLFRIAESRPLVVRGLMSGDPMDDGPIGPAFAVLQKPSSRDDLEATIGQMAEMARLLRDPTVSTAVSAFNRRMRPSSAEGLACGRRRIEMQEALFGGSSLLKNSAASVIRLLSADLSESLGILTNAFECAQRWLPEDFVEGRWQEALDAVSSLRTVTGSPVDRARMQFAAIAERIGSLAVEAPSGSADADRRAVAASLLYSWGFGRSIVGLLLSSARSAAPRRSAVPPRADSFSLVSAGRWDRS